MPGTDSAFSIDGREFEFDLPISETFPVGGYVEIDEGGRRHLGQVLEERAARGSDGRAGVAGRGVLVGTVSPDGEVGRISAGSFGDAGISAATAELVRSHLARSSGDQAILEIGSARPEVGAPATLLAKGFGRHTFMCGQSGSGKTFSMGVVLERLLAETTLRIVILDPNSDYVHLGDVRDPEVVGVPEPDQLRMRERLSEVAPRVKVFGGSDDPLKVRFGRLSLRQQAMVVGLDPVADAEEFDVARRIVEDMGTRDYGLADIRDRAASLDESAARRLRLRIDNSGLMAAAVWAGDDDTPVGQRLGDDWRALVLDLGSLATPVERSIVSAGLVATLWENRRQRQPVLLVIDEAHNVCPQAPTDSSQALATEHLIAIAGEGRKFGIYLMLATQRPQKVHENVLSQCDNLILMKMNSALDIGALQTTFSFVPPALVAMSSGFGLGEGLAAGPITSGPMLFKTGARYTPEGGADVPATWASRRD
jgi:uncharacterized protein